MGNFSSFCFPQLSPNSLVLWIFYVRSPWGSEKFGAPS
ncbi:MAG: hypothetical protein [Olavius algarvensis Gamma 1 endosymbiont]|nr:MAG: hypothetical protein [Olavius algarvensis Gamma 1 endosymbiont]